MSVYTLQKQWDSYQISTEKCVVCVFAVFMCVCMLCHYTLHSCLSYTFPRSFPNDALSLYQMSLHSRMSHCAIRMCPIVAALSNFFAQYDRVEENRED